METGFMNRITGLVIALVVGGLLVGGLLIPSIEGMTATEKTFENEGSPFMLADSGNHTIIIGMDANSNITITTDGETDIVPDLSLYGSATILYAEDSFIRLLSNGNVMAYGKTSNSTYDNATLGNASTEVTITISGTTATFDVSGSDRTIDNVQAFIAHEGTYALTTTPYIKDDSVIYGAGLTPSGGISGALCFYGTIEDITAKGLWPSGRIAKIDTINTKDIAEYVGLQEITSVVLAWGDGAYDQSATYTYFLAPASITVDLSHPMTPTQIAMFGVISILGIVALVVVAANGIRNKY